MTKLKSELENVGLIVKVLGGIIAMVVGIVKLCSLLEDKNQNICLIVGIFVAIAVIVVVLILLRRRLAGRKKLCLKYRTPPEPNFVGRKEMLKTISEWYNDPDVRVGALIGWGGVGKSALVRKWYDSLKKYKIRPDGIFWWGFNQNASFDLFLDELLRCVSQDEVRPKTIDEKLRKIKDYIHKGAYLIILDGLEEMQKSESGAKFGEMKHTAFKELLHDLADSPKGGLCLITTRYDLKDLDGWHGLSYKCRELTSLETSDALVMLRNRGVKGNEDDIKKVIEDYKGHALSLTSVAGFVKKHYDGDIKMAPKVKFVLGNEKRFEDVHKLLDKYAEKMQESELVFLKIFSLFRGEVTKKEFAGVFQHKIEGTNLNDVLIKMKKLDFEDLVDGLVDWRLVSYDETKKTYTTHPLVKGYFEAAFDKKDKKLCHKRIYQYFGKDAPERPETLEEMQPLFEQVYHGCAAELHNEVLQDVYRDKINRGKEGFITHKLGAWETDLSLAKTFFPEGDLTKEQSKLEKSDQSWLLHRAGLALVSTGRPKESEKPLLKAAQMEEDQKNEEGWKKASVGYQILAYVHFRTGNFEKGLKNAELALKMAGKARSQKEIIKSETCRGLIHHLKGEKEEARKCFDDAFESNPSIAMNDPYFSDSRVHDADFLMSTNRTPEALEMTTNNLKICQKNNLTNDISRSRRCLAAIERKKGNHDEAQNHLQEALKIAREVGVRELEIEAKLEYGRLHFEKGEHEDAISAGNEVLKLCETTGFKLYEPDAEVILAKAYLAQKDLEQAKTFANSALLKAKKMGYKLAENDASEVLKEIRT